MKNDFVIKIDIMPNYLVLCIIVVNESSQLPSLNSVGQFHHFYDTVVLIMFA